LGREKKEKSRIGRQKRRKAFSVTRENIKNHEKKLRECRHRRKKERTTSFRESKKKKEGLFYSRLTEKKKNWYPPAERERWLAIDAERRERTRDLPRGKARRGKKDTHAEKSLGKNNVEFNVPPGKGEGGRNATYSAAGKEKMTS